MVKTALGKWDTQRYRCVVMVEKKWLKTVLGKWDAQRYRCVVMGEKKWLLEGEETGNGDVQLSDKEM